MRISMKRNVLSPAALAIATTALLVTTSSADRQPAQRTSGIEPRLAAAAQAVDEALDPGPEAHSKTTSASEDGEFAEQRALEIRKLLAEAGWLAARAELADTENERSDNASASRSLTALAWAPQLPGGNER
jgi:hypothetical protein